MILLDLLKAFGTAEIVSFFWLLLLLDVPRYLLAAVVLAVIPPGRPEGGGQMTVCGLVACYNEATTIAACVASMRANGVAEIVVVNDGSTDKTHEVMATLNVVPVHLVERLGRASALNIGLLLCNADLVLVADADTIFEPGSVAEAARYFEGGVGGVAFELGVRNLDHSLITRFQGIEYAIAFTAGRRAADAFDTLSTVSGAAGLFRRDALLTVGGYDCEVAEDAALTMKLRVNGWRIRYAPRVLALTAVPQDMVGLLMQRLRWDAGIITIWWFKYRSVLNPFGPRFTLSNLLTSLDVLVFGAVLPLVLPVYVFWLWTRIGEASLILLGAVLLVLAAMQVLLLVLVRAPVRLLPYVPFYLLVETLVMRPLRVFALVSELVFSISRFDPYMPKSQRDQLT